VSFLSEVKYGDEIDLCLADSDGSRHFIEVRNVKSNEPVLQSVIDWIPSK
jgi:hypothetical protein